jgi:hypothetical protein
MRAESGAKRRIVGQQIFPLRGCRQAQAGFTRRRHAGEQRQLFLDAGHRPARLVAVANQSPKCAGIGQPLTRRGVQACAPTEVFDIVEFT